MKEKLDVKEIDELVYWASLDGSELGDDVAALIGLHDASPSTLSSEFLVALNKEMVSVYEFYQSESRVVTTQEEVTKTVTKTKLVWSDEE